MLTISPELQKQIERNARQEGIAPDQWLQTAVNQQSMLEANKRLWEAENRSDIREGFTESGKAYTPADIQAELERRRTEYLRQTGGVYVIESDPSIDDITPEELEELKEDFRITEENYQKGLYYTSEEVRQYADQKLAELRQAQYGNS